MIRQSFRNIFFKANGGQINANIQPSNKVCSRVSVPKYTRELSPVMK